jgi:hypothetical protein
MEEKKPQKHSILNVFDIVVIIIAIALAAILFIYESGGTETVTTETKTRTITYTIELTGMQNGSAELVSVGDTLVDKIKKYDIGVVTSVDVSNTVRQTQDLVNGGTHDAEMTTLETAVIELEAECTETDTQITVAGGYIIRVGLPVTVKGPGYYGTGYIIAVDRGE